MRILPTPDTEVCSVGGSLCVSICAQKCKFFIFCSQEI